MRGFILFLLLLFCVLGKAQNTIDKSKFVDVSKVITDIKIELRYYSTNNFVGKKINGYNAPVAYLTKEAANALAQAATELRKKGFVFKIFDAYRPQSAVNHFKEWAKNPADTLTKRIFYPDLSKYALFAHGTSSYISSKSGHSRGSTVDLTIVNISTKKDVDMGSPFDFFGEISHHDFQKLSKEQIANRKLLKQIMEKYGFKPYQKEWWHYTLLNEPYPNTYFDFPVEASPASY